MMRRTLVGKRGSLLTVCLCCLLSSALLSCGSVGGKKNTNETLGASVEAFNNAVRWEEYRAASELLISAERDEFWNVIDEMQKRIRLMDFEIRDIRVEEDTFTGSAVLRYRYYSLTDPSVKTKMLHQKFRYLEKQKAWQITHHDLDLLLPSR